MVTDERLEESICSWLAQEAPSAVPTQVLQATFERTRRTRQQVGWRGLLGRSRRTVLAPVLGGAAVVVAVAAAVALGQPADRPAIGGPAATPDPRSPFLGTWISTSDADGGTQTMTVRAAQNGDVEIVVTDDVASVCSGTPSTMRGIGRVEGDTSLVIPVPVYTCDDGTQPKSLSGPPLSEQLRDLTYVLDAQADVLTVGPDSVWTRAGASPIAAPQALRPVLPQSSLEEVRPATTGSGKAVPEYSFLDGGLTYRAASPLAPSHDGYPGRDRLVIEGLLPDDGAPRRVLLLLANPRPIGPGCVEAPAPADAEALARSIGSDPDFTATAPLPLTIGGRPAVQMDVVLAPGASSCSFSEPGMSGTGPLLMTHAPFLGVNRARLSLVDLPAGSGARVLAIVTITDDDSFETVLGFAKPVVDSIEFPAS